MRLIGSPTDYVQTKATPPTLDQSRQLIPLDEPTPLARTESEEQTPAETDQDSSGSGSRETLNDYEVRYLSPRDMVDLSQDLYMQGIVNFDEYATMAFQPELQPDYNHTIGALTGEPAEPDRKRDFVSYWEDRLAFEQKYNTIDSKDVAISRRIVDVLRALETEPANIVV